jgi:hypothetical protein
LTEESPVDHRHHNSIWLGQDELDGHNLWLTAPGCGHVTGDLSYRLEDNAAVFAERCRWESSGGETLLLEERRVRIVPAATGESCHILDFESLRSAPGDRPVRLGQTKEAGLGIRMLQQLDGEDGGVIEDSLGRQGEAGTFDRQAAWVDYWGTLGGRRLGLALLPHPADPAQSWFTRDYGIVVWNHVRAGPATIEPGAPLRLRFRLLAHDGSPAEAEIARHYAEYCALS